MGAVQWLALVSVCYAAAHAIGVSSKVDLPSDPDGSDGVHRRTIGVDGITPELVQAVLNVNVRNRNSHQNPGQNPPGTRVNAVICVNGAAPCPSPKTPIADEDEEEEEERGHGTAYGKDDQNEEEEEESRKNKPGIVYVDQDDDPESHYGKKKKKKKIEDVPVIIGYKGTTADDTQLDDPIRNTYDYDQIYHEVPVYTGFKLGPEFDKPHHIYSYLQPPERDVAVTYKHVPIGFDESTLVTQLLENSPLIKALRSAYNPVIQHHTGADARIDLSPLHPAQGVLHSPGFVSLPAPVPGFYGGIQPRTFWRNRGVARPGCRYPAVYQPNRPVPWITPQPSTGTVDDKVNFEDEDEDTVIDVGGTPTVINVDGKLGDALAKLKT